MSKASPSEAALDPPKAYPSAHDSYWPAIFFALGTFAIGTEGFMIAPLLPRMAADFAMSVPAVAMLVVVFTLALSLSSPLTTVATSRLNRRDILLLAMGVFTVANLVAATSSSFSSLLFSRLMMAVAAGLYIPNANALAGTVVGPERRGRALAIVSGGMTIAIALGLPLGSLVGHAFGWRSTFLAVAVMGAVAFTGILGGVGRAAGKQMHVASLAERLGVIGQAEVRRLLVVTLFWSVGAYMTYPYIAPYLAAVLDFGETGISATVSLWGTFAAIGVMTGGSLTDRLGSNRVVRGSLLMLAAAFWTMAAAVSLSPSRAQIPALLAIAAWGFSVWSFFPAQMARLIAAGSPQQASVALSLNTSTMYFGFSLGSALGAAVLDTGAIWGIGLLAGLSAVIGLRLTSPGQKNRPSGS
ncbi:MAG: MFS transporter [Rhodocyclales bacterium GT-UBC]|nr:MAG: MFS transporter [Rhodocyclales bacterium GT-UBC]